MHEVVRLTSRDGTPLQGLYRRAAAGGPAVVVVPGLGSVKENHRDFQEACAAAGLSSLALDLRGHGASGGRLDGGAVDDVVAGLGHLAGLGHPVLGLRGSSMGGLLALHAAARHPAVRAVVAICPAQPHLLARRTQDEWPLRLPRAVPDRPDGVARGYWHARGDEVVPWAGTFALAQASPRPRALRVESGGHHRSLQHDPAVMAATVAFLGEHLR